MHGDGNSHVFCGDCFKATADFPVGKADVVLMNPPFGASLFKFLDRGLEGLKDGGRLVAVVKDTFLCGDVRKVCALPSPLLQLSSAH
jgi:16S rRNA G1207 methylase RsmC